MSLWLKQSTAVTVKAGPFLDSTDGVALENALSIAQADCLLSKNFAAFAQKNDATSATVDGTTGHYGVPLNTTDTGTAGRLRLFIAKTGACPVWQDFLVVPAAIYDSLIGGTDTLPVDVTQVDGVALATHASGNLPADCLSWKNTTLAAPDTAGYVKATIKDGTGQGELNLTSGRTDANVTHWKDGVAGDIATATDIWNDAICTTRTLTAATNITSTDAKIQLGTDARVKVSADAHTSGETVAAVTGNVGGSVASVTGAVGSVTGAVGSVTGGVGGNVTGSVGSVATGGITAASFAANAITASVVADGAIDAGAVASDAGTKIADALLDRDMSDVVDNGTEIRRTPLQALRACRNKVVDSAGTMTVYKENDTTPSFTATTTRSAVNPITAIDPTST